MWKASMDPKIEGELKQDEAEIWKDIQNMKGPGENLLKEYEDYTHDQGLHEQNILNRFKEAMDKLDTPKHRMQL